MLSGIFNSLRKRLSSEHYDQNSIIIETINTANGKKAYKKYIKVKKLGSGAFAECFETQNIETKKHYATKIIAKDNKSRLKLLNELVIHQLLHHPNIVDFSHAFQDQQFIYVFMQLCPNKSLEDLLSEKKTLPTSEIKRLISQIIEGVKYIHSKKLIHRDIKPRNIFLGQNNVVKIGDFGLACKLQFEEDKKRSLCGTPQYMPPEVIQGRSYGQQVDIWAIGILLYEMYTGKTPFLDTTNEKIMENICSLQYNFPEKGIPKAALNLIKRILIKNGQLRPSLQQILQSPFMKGEHQLLSIAYSPRRVNTFNINFQQNTYRFNTPLPRSESAILKKKSALKKQLTPYIVDIQQVGTQIILYTMSNKSTGVFHKNKQILHQGKSIVNLTVEEGLFDGNRSIKLEENQGDPKLKQFLKNYKTRKSVQNSSKLSTCTAEKEVYLSKFTKHRNIFILRLSNNFLQLLFEDKTSFLLNLSKINEKIAYIDERDKIIQISIKQLTNIDFSPKDIEKNKLEYLLRVFKSVAKSQLQDIEPTKKKSKLQSSKRNKTTC